MGLVSEVDGPLGKSVLLTHFAQPEVCPGWATQLPVLLQGEGICGEPTSRSARLSSPLPRAILFWRVFPSKEKRGSFCRRRPLHLTEITSLHHLSKREAQVPHPLTRNLPEFLATLRVGAPSIWVFFDILIGKDRLECSTAMIEIQDILNQESASRQCGDEEFIDPLIHSLAHGDFLARRRSRMTGHNHPSGASKPAPSSSHPPSNNSTTISVFIAVTRAVGG